MSNTITTRTAIPPYASESLIRQLVSFQQTIECRGPGLDYPSPQEMNLQAKLITNVIKINRYNAVDQAAKMMKSFLASLRKEDKELARVVAEKYMEFMGSEMPVDIAEQAEQPTPAVPDSTVEMPPSSLPQFVSDPAPFNEMMNQKYAPLMEQYYTGDKEKHVLLDGVNYNKQVLEYNLLQYTLPLPERRFITDPARYQQLIDHSETKQKIEQHLAAR